MKDNSQTRRVEKKHNQNKLLPSKIRRKILQHVWFIRGLLLGFVIILFLLISNFVIGYLKNTKSYYYVSLIKNFIFTPESKLNSYNDRTNVLILGKAGGTHEAPDLTDSVIFTSIDWMNRNITLISISRDIWIPDLRAKLNSVYYWGNKRQDKGGIILARSEVEEIVGQPIHYVVVIDFEGFVGIINVLGGVNVSVERDFIDSKYPIAGKENDICVNDIEYKCRYETVYFNSGFQSMDGEKALKFARSRNAQGEEGTDFARAARQQKILDAAKDRILSIGTLSSVGKIKKIEKILVENIESDIKLEEAVTLGGIIFRARNNIRPYVLPESLLINPVISPKYDNLYVFIPKSGDWNEVNEWVDAKLN